VAGDGEDGVNHAYGEPRVMATRVSRIQNSARGIGVPSFNRFNAA
jgi:hypothetical protein